MYKSDKRRIEEAIIPYLFIDTMLCHIKQDGTMSEEYRLKIETLQLELNRQVDDLSACRRAKIIKRLHRTLDVLQTYFVGNNFNTRKAFLVLTEWARALSTADWIIIAPGSDYEGVINDFITVINDDGYGKIPDFDKIDQSAVKHIPKVHELAQQQGYYI